MTEPTTAPVDYTAVDRAHAGAEREALLEHARAERSVSECRDGLIVIVTPAELFARYGLDENGRPKPEPQEGPPMQDEHVIADPDLIAQFEEFARLNQLLAERKLEQYRGEYVIAGAGQIFAHNSNLYAARREAEPKAAAVGVPPARLADYFVPGNA